jgi:hypothetical protein
LDLGVESSEFGSEIKNPVEPTFAKVKEVNGYLVGEVLHVDGFGNVVTNISEKEIATYKAEALNVKLPEFSMKLAFGKTYANAKPQEELALIGSHGFLEIALNKGNAAAKFHVKAGDWVEVAPA